MEIYYNLQNKIENMSVELYESYIGINLKKCKNV